MTGICSSVCPISEDMICMVGLSDILRTVRRQAEQVVLRHRLWRVHGLLVLWLRGQRQPLREPGAVRPAVRGFQGAGQSVLGLGAIMLYPFAAFTIKRLLLRYTGWSEKNPAKLSELSLNFPKLADWLCMGWSVCQAAAKAGNSNRGNFFCTGLYKASQNYLVSGSGAWEARANNLILRILQHRARTLLL